MTYNKREINNKEVFLTGLTPLAEKGSYRFFTMTNGGEIVIVFKDQAHLIQLLSKYPTGLFAIKFFNKDNSKYSYRTTVCDASLEGKTVADMRLVCGKRGIVDQDIIGRFLIPKGGNLTFDIFIDYLQRMHEYEEYSVYYSETCRRKIRISNDKKVPAQFIGAYCLSLSDCSSENRCINVKVISKDLNKLKYVATGHVVISE